LAIVWALAESQNDFQRAAALIEPAIRLFPAIAPRILSRRDQEYLISEFSGLPGTAAAILLEAGREPTMVLEILEIGRGVIANLRLELRSDITELENLNSDEARALALEYRNLRERLDSSETVTEFSEDRDINAAIRMKSLQRNELALQFGETLTKIRRFPGLGRFLLGPTESDLKSIAGDSTIVVLSSSPVRCDAFIITSNEIKVCPLELGYSGLKNKTAEFAKCISESSSVRTYRQTKHKIKEILEWLWEVAVGPVLHFIGIDEAPSGKWPKVCWMGIDLFSTLPIHAAGYHGIGSTKTVINRVVSTYTATIKSLAYSKARLKKGGTRVERALFISMSTTPGMPDGDLNYADQEVKEASAILPSCVNSLILDRPRKETVLEEGARSDIVHFACHGVPHPTHPSQSHLRLQDWRISPLSVSELSTWRLKIPRIAYLSACFGAENNAEGLSDEGINLAGACQLSGFPTVIGTMWHVNDDDDYSVQIARRFYSGLIENEVMDVDKAHEALHRAVLELKEETRKVPGMSRVESDDPIVWGPYILVGFCGQG
jgi:hypothetical protein